jgi:hypothetical protein
VALASTATLGPPVRVAFAWVWQVAHRLGANGPGVAKVVRRHLGGLLGALVRPRDLVGALVTGITPCVQGTRS